jgi:amidase
MSDFDLLRTSALHQANLICTKQISPLELLQLYLARIDQVNPQLGAFFYVAREGAIEVARIQTELLVNKAPQDFPLLFGLPSAIKDLSPVAGMPCSYGVAALKEQVATRCDSIGMLINQAGCNILGKTAICELASLPFTESPGFLPTRNPWNLDHTSGGSSGGAAAAVAAGMLPFAPGDDGGGSLRGPAHCCGLVGIKPTRGRISNYPIGERLSGLASHGAIARNVADAAALLDALSCELPGDAHCLPTLTNSFLASTQKSPGRLRLGVCRSFPPFTKLDVAYGDVVDRVATILSNLGHQITEVSIDTGAIVEPFLTVWQTAVAAAGIPGEILNDFNRWLIDRSGSAAEYLNALYALQAISRQILTNWESFDVLITPVYMHSTIKVGEWAALDPATLLTKICEWIAPCPAFNATGQPALVMPIALEPETNLPIGIQLVGNIGAEAQLISLAAQLEQQVGALSGSIVV